jgi:hypothetical protein
MVAVVVLLFPRPVLALPTGCGLSTGSRYVSSHCSGGTGWYRSKAKAVCNGTVWYFWDGWTRPGFFSESVVNVPSHCYVIVGYLQKTG